MFHHVKSHSSFCHCFWIIVAFIGVTRSTGFFEVFFKRKAEIQYFMSKSGNDTVVIAETVFCALFCVPYLWPQLAQQLATSIFVVYFIFWYKLTA